MSKESLPKEYTPEERAKIQKERALSDAQAIKDGAEFTPEGSLEFTEDQINKVKLENEPTYQSAAEVVANLSRFRNVLKNIDSELSQIEEELGNKERAEYRRIHFAERDSREFGEKITEKLSTIIGEFIALKPKLDNLKREYPKFYGGITEFIEEMRSQLVHFITYFEQGGEEKFKNYLETFESIKETSDSVLKGANMVLGEVKKAIIEKG